MTPRDDFLLVTRLPSPHSSGSRLPQRGPERPTCVFLFCERPAVRGDLCESCWDKTQDLRAEYEELQAAFEDGWS